MASNDAGLVSAGGQLLLADRDSGAARLRIDNGSGTLIAGSLLSMNAAYFSGSGRALSLGDLILRQQGDLTTAGQLQANGTLDIAIGGTLSNSGQLLAGKALTLSSQALDNRASGELSATAVNVQVAGLLSNRGLFDGQQVRLQAATLDNLGSGRIYGDRLAIAANTLNNRDEQGRAAVIAAREQLDIGAQRIDNREDALLFSAGDLAIGGAIDANDQASGRAALLTNASATVESSATCAWQWANCATPTSISAPLRCRSAANNCASTRSAARPAATGLMKSPSTTTRSTTCARPMAPATTSTVTTTPARSAKPASSPRRRGRSWPAAT